MKLDGYIKAHEDFSGIASNVNRQLMFSAIALIWLFKYSSGTDKFILPEMLFIPIFLITIGLMLDLFQYISGSIIWYVFYRSLEKKNTGKEEDIKAPIWTSIFLNVLFYGKFLFVIIAYIYILLYAYDNIEFKV